MINIWLDSLASDHLDATQTRLIFSTLAQLAEQNTTNGQLQVQLHNSHAEPAVAQLKQTLAQHGWDEARVTVHQWTPIPGYPHDHPCNQTLRLHAAACHGAEVDLCFQAWPLDTRTVDTPIAQILVLINSTTGMTALASGVPVHCCGRADYAQPGLVHQGNLDQFWSHDFKPDLDRAQHYRDDIATSHQYPASYFLTSRQARGADRVAAGILSTADQQVELSHG